MSTEKKPRRTKIARVVNSIVARIGSGKLKEGERLPSEEQLSANFKVSLGTVQKALTQLAHQGFIIREHGRGTFVARTRRPPTELRYLTFRGESGEDLPLFVHIHSIKSILTQGPWSLFLGPSRSFIRIERMINVGGQFEIFSQFVLREDEFAAVYDLSAQELERLSLRETLRQQFSLPTLRMEQHIGFEKLPDRIGRLLGMPAGTEGFTMELFGYTTDERPLCYQRVYSEIFDAKLVVLR